MITVLYGTNGEIVLDTEAVHETAAPGVVILGNRVFTFSVIAGSKIIYRECAEVLRLPEPPKE